MIVWNGIPFLTNPEMMDYWDRRYAEWYLPWDLLWELGPTPPVTHPVDDPLVISDAITPGVWS